MIFTMVTELHYEELYLDANNLMYKIESKNVSEDSYKDKELFDFNKL